MAQYCVESGGLVAWAGAALDEKDTVREEFLSSEKYEAIRGRAGDLRDSEFRNTCEAAACGHVRVTEFAACKIVECMSDK